jgi:hypothetical protein
MLETVFSLKRAAVAAWVVVAWLGGAGMAFAQQEGTKSDTETPFQSYKPRFDKLVEYLEKVDPAKDKDLLAVAGRYHVYRLTWATEKSSVAGLHKDLKEIMLKPATREGKNRVFMKLFAHELVLCLKNLLGRDMKTSAHVVANAALMLPVVALCKQDEVNDFLIDLLKSDKDGKQLYHPYVRLCAVKGLGEINNPAGPRLDDQDDDTPKRLRDLKRFFVLRDFIDLPYPPEGKDEAHERAYEFARREGIKAMAQMTTPAVAMDKDKADGPVAASLLYYAMGGPLKNGPKLTMSERLEAALGVCNLKSSSVPSYNVPLAVHVVTKCVLDFALEYQGDYSYFKANPKAESRKGQAKMPWKYDAVRLMAGLDALAANASRDDPSGVQAANKLKQIAQGPLELIARHAAVTDEITLLRNLMKENRPANTEVYKGIKASELKVQ